MSTHPAGDYAPILKSPTSVHNDDPWWEATLRGEVVASGPTAKDVFVQLREQGIRGSIMRKVRR